MHQEALEGMLSFLGPMSELALACRTSSTARRRAETLTRTTDWPLRQQSVGGCERDCCIGLALWPCALIHSSPTNTECEIDLPWAQARPSKEATSDANWTE